MLGKNDSSVKNHEKKDRLTLDPPIPGSPGTPASPGLPGFPFNYKAKCFRHYKSCDGDGGVTTLITDK